MALAVTDPYPEVDEHGAIVVSDDSDEDLDAAAAAAFAPESDTDEDSGDDGDHEGGAQLYQAKARSQARAKNKYHVASSPVAGMTACRDHTVGGLRPISLSGMHPIDADFEKLDPDEFCKNCVIVRPKLFPDSVVAKAMFRAAEIARGPDEPAIGWARAREVFRNPNLGRGPAKDVFGRRLKRTRTSSAEVSSPAGFEPDHEAFSSPQSSRGQALHGDRYIPVLEALGVDPHSTL